MLDEKQNDGNAMVSSTILYKVGRLKKTFSNKFGIDPCLATTNFYLMYMTYNPIH